MGLDRSWHVGTSTRTRDLPWVVWMCLCAFATQKAAKASDNHVKSSHISWLKPDVKRPYAVLIVKCPQTVH